MDFSLIITSHNRPAAISRLLPRLRAFAQDACVDFEIIVVDDASNTETCNVLSQFYDSGVIDTLLKLEEKVGVSAARNEALQIVQRSRWVAFFDDDDDVDNNFSEALQFVNAKIGIDLVIFGYTRCSREAETIQFWPKTSDLLQQDVLQYLQKYCFAPNRLHAFVHVWSKFYSVEKIKQSGQRFSEVMQLHEDINFNLSFLVTKPKISYCSRSFYLHNASFTGQSFRDASDVHAVFTILPAIKIVQSMLIEHGFAFEAAQLFSRQLLWSYIIINIIRSGFSVSSISDFFAYLNAWNKVFKKPLYVSSINKYNGAITGGSKLIPMLIRCRRFYIALTVAMIRGKLRYRK